MREYKIGTMLRERYDQYFGPDYWPAKIYARSTVVPRTQLSLQLVLAGLFPPSERQTWNPHLPWIPAWTFFAPIEADNLLFSHYCHWWVTLQRIDRRTITGSRILKSFASSLPYAARTCRSHKCLFLLLRVQLDVAPTYNVSLWFSNRAIYSRHRYWFSGTKRSTGGSFSWTARKRWLISTGA